MTYRHWFSDTSGYQLVETGEWVLRPDGRGCFSVELLNALSFHDGGPAIGVKPVRTGITFWVWEDAL
jgi:hypothetical protein